MEIMLNLICLSIVLEDKRTFSLGFKNGFYLKSNELTSEELTTSMLASSRIEPNSPIPDVLLHFCYYEKTIDVAWIDGEITVTGNDEIAQDVKDALVAIGKGLLLSYDPTAIAFTNITIEGVLGWKQRLSIHSNPYRNRDQQKHDDWNYGWELANSFNPCSVVNI